MFSPENRTLLTEQIRPEPGYRLDHALITTYSLDLMTLLTVPLALTFFDWDEAGDGQPQIDPVGLLESLRSNAQRLTVVCQTGEIAVPTRQQALFAFLEPCVRGVVAPSGGSFHPKVWVLRFTSIEDKSLPVTYRMLCASRNLTFDRSWDLLVSLDGTTRAKAKATPSATLATFVSGVSRAAAKANLQLDDDRRRTLRSISREVAHVAFEPPDGFEKVRLHSYGFDRKGTNPTAEAADQQLIVSPFLTQEAVSSVGEHTTLVSRQEELDALPADVLDGVDVRVLSDLASPEPSLEEQESANGTGAKRPERDRERQSDSTDGLLRGLHAKSYILDDGNRARVFAGSANATNAAFSTNVEFLVELKGPRSKCGVDAALGDDQTGFAGLLDRYARGETSEDDPELEAAKDAADLAVRTLGQLALRTNVAPSKEDSGFDIHVFFPEGMGELPLETTVWLWPITLNPDRAQQAPTRGTPGASWAGLAKEQIIAFVGTRVVCSVGDATVERRVTLLSELVGAPADRESAIARSVLSSKNKLLRYLAFLLADQERDPAYAADLFNRMLSEPEWSEHGADPVFDPDFPLLESLVKALDRDPDRLDRVHTLIRDLADDEDGRQLLPEGFENIWKPLWEARTKLKKQER